MITVKREQSAKQQTNNQGRCQSERHNAGAQAISLSHYCLNIVVWIWENTPHKSDCVGKRWR
ncbi:Uncharacterised protein [Vibrio cholerae]|uniref:Uncharacterized protein n=1 Tax=Vibrio cholerae TaxID=666 RepID=A0A656A6T6_VIBCL|nr:Uncharacterised protein [Vibrio cholerae]CSB24768.1 Uncharacterised protein [Vibrio cholerae]CSB80027.1 Uncharacterised protein [Vibrio cholerae]CSC94477.1 Uncharacterised protein [Vibrio cholerae]CSD06962.1 Uncharacterised protein [Vibrio cholerae]